MSGDAEFARWMSSYQQAYLNPTRVADLLCPETGSNDLELLFLVNERTDENGLAVFFCRSRLRGLSPLYAKIPPGAVVRLRTEAEVPDYSLVLETPVDEEQQPDSADDRSSDEPSIVVPPGLWEEIVEKRRRREEEENKRLFGDEDPPPYVDTDTDS